MPDYYYKWAAVWIAAAAVLIIVIVAQEAPLIPVDEFEPLEPFPDEANSQLSSEKRYLMDCLLYTSPSPRDQRGSRMPSSA